MSKRILLLLLSSTTSFCVCGQVLAGGETKGIDALKLKRLVQERKFIQAEDEAQKLLRTNSNNPEAHYAYGELLRASGQLDQASYEFNRVIELAPKDYRPQVALAEICLDNMELSAALDHAQRAVDIAPKSLAARIGLISVLLKSEQTSAAEHELNDLFRQNKNNNELVLLSYRLCRQKGDYQEAKRYLQAVLSKPQSRTPSLLIELAQMYSATGEYDKEKTLLESIIDSYPLIPEARLRLARNLEAHGHNYKEAQAQYLEVLRIDPTSSAALAGLQRCSVKQNNVALRLKLLLRKL
ncbi:MAG: tetratricopeptide repeat protein [Candidatus Obscuribacterales bacterium]|nr:tetratricopeptide repeat protein [Candidatus Obscuribacterales bacterium]